MVSILRFLHDVLKLNLGNKLNSRCLYTTTVPSPSCLLNPPRDFNYVFPHRPAIQALDSQKKGLCRCQAHLRDHRPNWTATLHSQVTGSAFLHYGCLKAIQVFEDMLALVDRGPYLHQCFLIARELTACSYNDSLQLGRQPILDGCRLRLRQPSHCYGAGPDSSKCSGLDLSYRPAGC